MKTLGRTIAVAARRNEAVQLRIQGLSYRAIGRKLGVSGPRVYRMVREEMRRLEEQSKENAEQIVRIELERLDVAIQGIWPKVKRGDPKAVLALVRLGERRSKLLGLDAPVKAEITGRNGGPIPICDMTDAQLEAIVAQFRPVEELPDGGKVPELRVLPDNGEGHLDAQ